MNTSSEISTKNHIKLEYDFSSIKRIPFYFGSKNKPLLAWLHIADSKQHSNTGVVICPPLAVEYMNSYRSLRYTADYFALAGIPTLRFDYHGTGDSSGIEEDDNRLEEWLSSIHYAMDELSKITGCTKVGLFGFRMGATLASLVAEKRNVDFLILWAALNSGKKYIREIKLIQMTAKIQSDDNSLLEAGGMGYWKQTVNNISQINLNKIIPQTQRILLISRDEQTNDTVLHDAWKKSGLNIEQQYHVGSTLMLVDAHQTVVPHQTIQKIVQWVEKELGEKSLPSNIEAIVKESIPSSNIIYKSLFIKNTNKHNSAEQTVSESILYFGENNRNIAILSETEKSKTANLPTIIISNSGANHRVGPSRLYVLIARELSLLGFRCVRIDVPGIGDSIISNQTLENIEYINESSNKISAVISQLESDTYSNQYILMGLCSGAYFSFHAALELKKINIVEIILINPLTFYWEQGMTVETSSAQNFSIWNWYKQAITSKESWIKLAKGKIDYKSLFNAIKDRIKTKYFSKIAFSKNNNSATNHFNKHRNKLSTDLARIADNGCHLQFILSRSDPGYDILMINAGRIVKNLKKNNKLGIDFIEQADHTFSKYTPRCSLMSTIIAHFKNLIHHA